MRLFTSILHCWPSYRFSTTTVLHEWSRFRPTFLPVLQFCFKALLFPRGWPCEEPDFSPGSDGSQSCSYLFIFAWPKGNPVLFPGWSPLPRSSWSLPWGPAAAGANSYCYWSVRCTAPAGNWPPSPALPLSDSWWNLYLPGFLRFHRKAVLHSLRAGRLRQRLRSHWWKGCGSRSVGRTWEGSLVRYLSKPFNLIETI